MKKIIVLLSVVLLISCKQTNIAYVNVEELMEAYEGTKELEGELTGKQEALRKRLDSITAPFQARVQDYVKSAAQMSAKKRAEAEQLLQQENQGLQAQQQQYSQQLQLESQELSEELTKKVDSFVADYAKLNGINIILGTSGKGTVMYGDDALNITDELAETLNEAYIAKK